MKKLAILSLMVISALSVDAQRKRTRTATSEGNVVLRMGFGVNYDKHDPDLDEVHTQTKINFNPSLGYMIVDNLELGVNFSVANTSYEHILTQSPILNKTVGNATDVGFGVYAQKYFPLNNWFALTTTADLGITTGTYSTDNIVGSITTPVTIETGNRNGVGGSLNFGFAFTPYNAFSLQANIAGFGVNSMKTDPDGVNNTDTDTHVGFNVWRNPYNLTAVVYFGRGLWKK
ncbi:MAG: outer membrane beta-barrel protein [Chitinophagaceae bacterium]